MWTAKDSDYVYSKVFKDFYQILGTELTKEQVFGIRVNIKTEQENYEKLRQLAIEFFNDYENYQYYAEELKFAGLKDFDAARDLFENFVRVANKISGKGLDIQGSNPGEIFRQLTSYEKPYDILEIGELEKLKRIANGKSVFTVRELFDFFQFEFKTCLALDSSKSNDYDGLINAILYVFNYNKDYIKSNDRSLVNNVVKLWKEGTEGKSIVYPYKEFRTLIFNATSTGKGANSPLRLIFLTIVSVVKWISAERRLDTIEWAIRAFMIKLQEISKPN